MGAAHPSAQGWFSPNRVSSPERQVAREPSKLDMQVVTAAPLCSPLVKGFLLLIFSLECLLLSSSCRKYSAFCCVN